MKSWMSSVRSTKTLTIHNEISGGAWANMFRLAVEGFKTLKLPVKLKPADDAATANVLMRLGNGVINADHNGQSFSENFDGKRLHGRTMQIVGTDGIEKAVIFLPEQPQSNEPSGMVDATQDIKLVIAVHELIHACGLEDEDHSKDGGLFYFPLGVSDGKLIVPEVGKNKKPMPPLVLSHSASNQIHKLWK